MKCEINEKLKNVIQISYFQILTAFFVVFLEMSLLIIYLLCTYV